MTTDKGSAGVDKTRTRTSGRSSHWRTRTRTGGCGLGLEAVCVEIIKLHSKPFLVTTVYRPPSLLPEFFDDFEKLIKAIDKENKEMHILGDLNCNMLKTDKDANILSY